MEVIMRSKLVTFVLLSVVLGFPITANVRADNPTPPVAGRVPLGVTVAEAELIATGWRVSKLLHSDVRNDKGEKIGKIDDILVSSDGTLSTAIIDVGGLLGIGTHRVAIPVRQLSLSDKGNKITLQGASKDALKALPEFQYAN
jgi:hypothetical protein